MALTEGRVAKPERRWDCRRGTPMRYTSANVISKTVRDSDIVTIDS